MTLPPLAAEVIFHIGSFSVTNALLNAWMATVLFAIFAFFLNSKAKKYYTAKNDKAPKGLVNFFESIVDLFLKQMDSITFSRKKTLTFLPLVGTIFLFILVSNWAGLLPGTGSVYIWGMHHGLIEKLPLLRPANTDLNLTLAMAVSMVVLSHVVGIVVIGFFKYANKFIKLGDIYYAVKSLNVTKIFVAGIEFFVGILEIISEIAKMLSLSLRLFGNIFAGEVLLTVIAGIFAYVLPLPFMGLELIVGVVQAMVFSILVLVYLVIATTPVAGHEKAH